MQIQINKRIIYLAALLCSFVANFAFANQKLTRYFTQHAERVIGKYIDGDDFQVVVNITAKEENTENTESQPLPYLPGGSTLLHPEDATSLRQFVENVSIQVYLPERVNQAREGDIQRLLVATFGLLTDQGDRVLFERMQFGNFIQQESPEQRRQAGQITDIQNQLRSSQERLETLSTERDDLKRELTVVQRDLESAERQNAGAENRPKATVQEKMLDAIGLALIAVALLIGTGLLGFLLMRAVSGLGNNFQTAVTNLAQSVEKIGSSGGDSDDLFGSAKPIDSDSGAIESNRGGGSVRIGETYERVFALQEEIQKTLEEPGAYTEIALLDYVTRNLDRPENKERSVSAMEILGKERANQLFKKLGNSQQDEVIAFLNSRAYSKSKAEILLEVGEELRTILMNGDILRGRSELNPDVKSTLLRLSPNSTVQVVENLDANTLARFFAYIPADQVAEMLSELKSNESALEKMSEALTLMPQKSRSADLDSAVQTAVQQVIEEDEKDLERPYLAFYSRVIEKTAEGVNDQVISALSRGSEKIGTYLASTVVTFNTFFQLKEDIRESIIDGMSIADLAAAITLLKPEQISAIEKLVDERRMEIIRDDATQIEGWSEREKKKTLQNLQGKIVTAIRKIQGDDPLEDLIDQGANAGGAS